MFAIGTHRQHAQPRRCARTNARCGRLARAAKRTLEKTRKARAPRGLCTVPTSSDSFAQPLNGSLIASRLVEDEQNRKWLAAFLGRPASDVAKVADSVFGYRIQPGLE